MSRLQYSLEGTRRPGVSDVGTTVHKAVPDSSPVNVMAKSSYSSAPSPGIHILALALLADLIA